MSSPAFATFSNCASSESSRCRRFATRRESVPSGFVSVMPQPWITSTPSRSQYQRMSETGGAEPPQVSRSSFERSQRAGSASIAARAPCQMVGTPAEMVTCSAAIRSSSALASMKRCGMTCFAPSMVALNGRPQPMAWNMGTMPHTLSVAERPIASVIDCAMVCR